jgi:hypothetical protein
MPDIKLNNCAFFSWVMHPEFEAAVSATNSYFPLSFPSGSLHASGNLKKARVKYITV